MIVSFASDFFVKLKLSSMEHKVLKLALLTLKP